MKIEETINRIIKNQISYQTDIDGSMLLEEDLGLDSLRRTQVICSIEEDFGIEFQIEDLCSNDMKIVQDLYDVTEKYIR